tara:strand:+ start:436 stop:1170 length:735 start_codon:yes stop_codon:yes gene_type:complete
MSEFSNKVIVITGGYKGNGLAIVENFINNNAKVYSLDSKYPKKKEINGKLVKLKTKIDSFKQIKNIINEIGRKEKKIDVLINNAGISLKLSKKNILSHWNKTIATNLTAPYLLSLLCLPYLKKSKQSSIVNITSLNGKIAMSNNPAYNASKGGLSALTFCLAMDFSKYSIRVNGVSPGYIKTDMTKKSLNNKYEFKKRINRMMIPKYGSPKDIADAVFFLASKNAGYINATEIVVDGGLLKKGI